MRRIFLALLLMAAPVTGVQAVQAGVAPLEANDLGGIIAWSPVTQRHARHIATEHCAGYGKRAQITSVTARYGGYIGFACQFPRTKVVRGHKRAPVVLRVKY
jgi:hypothetical protein